MELGQTGEMLTFANPKGRGIFDQFEDLKDELQASKIMQSQFQDTQNRLVERLGMLENEVGVLKVSSEGFVKLRRRFLENYKKIQRSTKRR